MTRSSAVRELLELIAALDRRVPQVQRAGEASIARDAAALKGRALKRIESSNAHHRPPRRRECRRSDERGDRLGPDREDPVGGVACGEPSTDSLDTFHLLDRCDSSHR